ncbi:MAG TPA: RbsD/FucU domain-containing protein [Tepidisphaeraceae bacterium]|jgi:D-ribose pyranose/furanose isomerase RbsD|nr:RbsD/FucU domain-containing protein [Tepidisphaeraceae bacterium]
MTESSSIIGASSNWREVVSAYLPRLGHRNWIVIADAAYPAQSAPGIETIVTGATMPEVTDYVLTELRKATHVRPLVLHDEELDAVAEQDAPGVTALREGLKSKLDGLEVETLPHKKIIRQLADLGEVFEILLLKTTLTIPYTTLFIRLECGYWPEAAEKRLRRALRKKK